ncbi:MAG: co-chaperone GroES [Candidatus Doudnabacteria bacterium]|nr:co-chaperone GroES [Candidatus Doudnabacteria bacterium]
MKKTSKSGKANIVPLGDKILVKPLDRNEEKTESGIYLPETAKKEKPEQGKVVAVGEGRFEDGKRIPPQVKIGDMVIFSKYGYDEVKINDEEYFILKEENILAIIK